MEINREEREFKMKQIKTGMLKRARITTLAEDYAGYSTFFYAQHGISFLIEVENASTTKRILFDVAHSAESILHNMELLKIDLSSIDMIFLSHTHWDHTWGLIDMLKAIDKEIPIIVHPDIFRPTLKFAPAPMYNGLYGISGESTISKIEENKGKLFFVGEPFSIIDGVLSTGEIREKVEFEKEIAFKGAYVIKDGLIKEDDLHDEMSVVLSLPDGLAIVIGCGHPGVASIVNKAKSITGIQKVKTVIGGFHLVDASDERIQKSVRHLKETGVERVFTGHCTGLKAEAEFMKEFGERFEKSHSGKIIEF